MIFTPPVVCLCVVTCCRRIIAVVVVLLVFGRPGVGCSLACRSLSKFV
jgi:hypothetical protein